VRSIAASTLRYTLLLAVVVMAVSIAGCGYTVRGHLPEHIKTVAVPVFVNRSTEPFVEGLITRAIVQAFSTNGRLKVVKVEDADAILEGEVASYVLSSIAFDPRANVRQYRLTVTLHLRLRDVKQGKIIFEQSGFQERADFQVVSAVADTISREETAVSQAAAEIARTVVNLAVERF
jgi:outer membrane lipopolysaccharide assembly protein LptE/RlpB